MVVRDRWLFGCKMGRGNLEWGRMERFLGEGWSRFVAEGRQLLVEQLVEGRDRM